MHVRAAIDVFVRHFVNFCQATGPLLWDSTRARKHTWTVDLITKLGKWDFRFTSLTIYHDSVILSHFPLEATWL